MEDQDIIIKNEYKRIFNNIENNIKKNNYNNSIINNINNNLISYRKGTIILYYYYNCNNFIYNFIFKII